MALPGGPGLGETLPRPLGWGIPPRSRPSSLSDRGGSDHTLPNKLIFYSFISYVGVFHDKRRGSTGASPVLSPPPSRRAQRRALLLYGCPGSASGGGVSVGNRGNGELLPAAGAMAEPQAAPVRGRRPPRCPDGPPGELGWAGGFGG